MKRISRSACGAVILLTGLVASSVATPAGADPSPTKPTECTFSTHGVRIIVNPPGRAVVRFVNTGDTDAQVLLTNNIHHSDQRGRRHTLAPGAAFGFGPSALRASLVPRYAIELQGYLFISTPPFGIASGRNYLTDRINACLNGIGAALPWVGVSGARVTFTSGGFAAGEIVNLYADNNPTVPLASVQANSTGTFTARRVATPPRTLGPHTFVAVGETSGLRVDLTYTVRPSLILTPASGPIGTHIVATLAGFGPSRDVAVRKGVPKGRFTGPIIVQAHTDLNGSARVEFDITDAFATDPGVCALQDQQAREWACTLFTIR